MSHSHGIALTESCCGCAELRDDLCVLCRAQLAQMLAESEWGDKSKRYFLSREEEHVGGLKAATAIW